MSADLFSIQQREGGPLRKYIERFNDEIIKIEDLNQGVAYSAMLHDTLNEDFKRELLAKTPNNVETLMALANTTIRVDDGQNYLKKMKEYKRELSLRGDRRSPKRSRNSGGNNRSKSLISPNVHHSIHTESESS